MSTAEFDDLLTVVARLLDNGVSGSIGSCRCCRTRGFRRCLIGTVGWMAGEISEIVDEPLMELEVNRWVTGRGRLSRPASTGVDWIVLTKSNDQYPIGFCMRTIVD